MFAPSGSKGSPATHAARFVCRRSVVVTVLAAMAAGTLGGAAMLSNTAIADARSYIGFGPGYFAPAFKSADSEGYKTCAVKSQIEYGADGPKKVTRAVCRN